MNHSCIEQYGTLITESILRRCSERRVPLDPVVVEMLLRSVFTGGGIDPHVHMIETRESHLAFKNSIGVIS